MKLHKAKYDFKNKKEKKNENNEKEKEESQNIINNNKIIENIEKDNENLSSPVPNFQEKKEENIKNQKNKLYEMIEVEHEDIFYRLFIYLNEEEYLVIELIPKDGYLPYSYKNIFDMRNFYDINRIFMDLKTLEKVGEKIITLYKKGKVSFKKDQNEEIFYLVLKITIIDEDKEVFLPLNQNDNIQICTINYLLKEAEKLKNEFNEYKNDTEDIINQQLNEINGLKRTNELYSKIIRKIKSEYDKKNKNDANKDNDSLNENIDNENNKDEDEEDKGENKIIENKEKNEINVNNDEDEELEKVDELIIDEDEKYKEIKNKISKMEKELNDLTKKHKCDINSKFIVLNLSMNQVKPYVLIYFELENTGINSLTCKFDDIFCNLEGINEGFISFYNEDERYIKLEEPLLTNQKIIVCKKLKINNPSPNRKYDFFLNIYTLKYGRISEKPIKFQICIRENEKQENFINFLKNKKWGFNYKNNIKNQKIIFEYAQNMENNDKNNYGKISINKVNKIYEIKKDEIKIRKFIYDAKAEMAFENNDKDEENNELDKIDKYLNNPNMNIIINNDDVNSIIKRIHNKYKNSRQLDKNKIEEVICSCIGDFGKISNLIENMI